MEADDVEIGLLCFILGSLDHGYVRILWNLLGAFFLLGLRSRWTQRKARKP